MSSLSKNQYPIYIISKGRWESRLTSRALEESHTDYRIVVEPQEYNNYAKFINPAKILILPFSNLGQGSIPARNWVWEHSLSEGQERHWILDDNIDAFYRFHQNKKIRLSDASGFKAIETFTDRYSNIALAGMQYRAFAIPTSKHAPLAFNTRIYSCILIQNDIPYQWRGRYNEDTDLSLRVLKDGWCTALFYAFLCDKRATMLMKGGNTDQLYADNGRLLMAQSLQKQHPDVVTIAEKWGRPQHVVNYKPFAGNKLQKRDSVEIIPGVDNFGMVLKNKRTG